MRLEAQLSDAAIPVLAEPLKELLRSLAKVEPQCEPFTLDPHISRGDPVTTAALVLSIPGALIATIDLVERAHLAAKIRALLQKVSLAKGAATLKFGDHPYLDLKDATEDQVMDLIFRDRG